MTDYIRANRDRYSREAIRAQLIAAGHDSAAIDAAWEKVTRLDPASPFAQRARLHARTALDLQHIFATDAA